MTFTMRAILTLLFVLASSISVNAQDTQIPLECHNGVQVIGVVGTNVPNGTQSYGLTRTFIRKIMQHIPDSGNFSLNYDRFPPGGNETAASFREEVQLGVAELYEAINNYTTACPLTSLVLHGYSEGAVVIMNLLCGASSGSFPPTDPLNPIYSLPIIGVILYGDESRTANQTYDFGGCSADGPHLGRRNPQGCNAFASAIQSYCFANDLDCCGTADPSVKSPNGLPWHYLYPSYFDNQAVNFVISQYNKFKVIGTVSTISTSPTPTLTTSAKSTTTTSSSKSTITTSTSSSKSTTTTTISSTKSITTSTTKKTTSTTTRKTSTTTTKSA